MARLTVRETSSQRVASRSYRFTVVFQPVADEAALPIGNGSTRRRTKNSAATGYQVTVPVLPGLITYGRTLAEARDMAADAIRVHIAGLRRDGEPVPDESEARTEKLRVAI